MKTPGLLGLHAVEQAPYTHSHYNWSTLRPKREKSEKEYKAYKMNRERDFQSMAMSQIQTNLARLKILSNKIINNLRKGETFELRTELNSEYRERRREAVRRVIANMTVGKDVSGLFTDVLKNMQTDDLETKKLIYLYLMNYSKVKPDLVILAVNTFLKDSEDKNPLLRALAIRTMGCLQVIEILDYIIDPLRRCLHDNDAYVRKTSAVCVAKVYELSPDIAMEYNLVDTVKDMITDRNALVVADAVSSLREINQVAMAKGIKQPVWVLDRETVEKLSSVMNDCTEWGQISILEAFLDYSPYSENEAISICKSVLPRLQHANCSVALTSIRLLLSYERFISDTSVCQGFINKIIPPLVSLLSNIPEIQYVVLRNISLVLQKYSGLLSKEIRIFFLKYNDPEYIKFEKLNLLVSLCERETVELLLSELSEYAKEIDPNVSRRAAQAIEKLAMKFHSSAEKCLESLTTLIELKNTETFQESTISISKLARAFDDLADSTISETLIPSIAENQSLLSTDPNAKAALISMAGGYKNVKPEVVFKLLAEFEPQFLNEEEKVQLALVHASVAFFLRNPEISQALVFRIIKKGAEECASMDVRDISYIYWRLLSGDPEIAKGIVLTFKPNISSALSSIPEPLYSDLLNNLGCVSSVLMLPPPKFLKQIDMVSRSLNSRTSLESEYEQLPSSSQNVSSKYSNGQFNDSVVEEEPELLISL
ncbi:hypothetical protein BB560_001037 [Smittium megazygosporum]|uniref:AP complex subunit beta n=1 Tax=Smittium megazygosporum TaxID=133381 RepID=A0A2T9ZIS8_9FUNG|nr:hypothetical protein BB560_001037 [Smittium megazygosporum]